MEKSKLPFYYRNWFWIVLFLLGPATYYITTIAAVVLMLAKDEELPSLSKEDYAKYKETIERQDESIVIVKNAKTEAKGLLMTQVIRLSKL